MIELLTYILFSFLILRLGVSFYNLFSFPYLKQAALPDSQPLISVLIPARNEAKNIKNLLHSLKIQEYTNLEVLVLDDYSDDDTYKVVDEFIKSDSRFLLLKGETLPDGWFGKNWACHQLSLSAKGDYFLFLDADVTLIPSAIQSALAEMQLKKLKLLSLFPDQQMVNLAEKIVVPIMHYLLLALLPLRLVFKNKNPSFSAANGQFMLFDAETYRMNNFHQQFYNTVIEDIAIIKSIKKKELAVETLLGNRLVICRMYNNFDEAVEGFSKNLFAGFNNNLLLMCAYFFLVYFGYFIIVWHLSWSLIFVFLILIILMRISIAILAKQNIIEQLLLHPLQMCMLIYLGCLSYYRKKRKQITWKGRTLEL